MRIKRKTVEAMLNAIKNPLKEFAIDEPITTDIPLVKGLVVTSAGDECKYVSISYRPDWFWDVACHISVYGSDDLRRLTDAH